MSGYQREVCGVIYLQLVAIHVLDDQNLCSLTGICSNRQAVEVAVIQQGVVLAYRVFPRFHLRLIYLFHVKRQLGLFLFELFRRDESGAAVDLGVRSPGQPAYGFIVKTLNVDISASCKEVVLHILDHCL